MGETSSRNLNTSLPSAWQTVSSVGSVSGNSIVRDPKSNLQGELVNYTLNNYHDPTAQELTFLNRKTNRNPVVDIYSSSHENKGTGLVPVNNMKVVTENIPNRLNNAPQLSYDESLYVLDSSLAGYQHLYSQDGPFTVTSNMIGFNDQGHTKVWHNSNYGNNHPQFFKHILVSTAEDKDIPYTGIRQEANVVRNVINVVEDKNEQGRFPQNLRTQLKSRDIGFAEARSIVQNEIAGRPFRVDHIDFVTNMIKTTKTSSQTSMVQTKVDHYSSYLFRYKNPSEYFHPQIYAGRQ